MFLLIAFALLTVVAYGYMCWKENQKVDPSEKVMHLAFRIGPLIVIGLLGAAVTMAKEPIPTHELIYIERGVERITIQRRDMVEQTIARIRCRYAGGQRVPTIERWGKRTIIVRCA